MNEELKLVAMRVSSLREMSDIDPKIVADALGISMGEYLDYELGNKDFAFSQLHTIATMLKVDVSTLLTGDDPKLSSCTVVRAGKGFPFERRKEFTYEHLAHNFKNAKMEPFYVLKQHEENEDLEFFSAHAGQEFDYILSGVLKICIGGNLYELNAGDSVYYDSGQPHSMKAIGKVPCEFLAIIIK